MSLHVIKEGDVDIEGIFLLLARI